MNLLLSGRPRNQLLTLFYIAAIITVTALSIELLYRFFQFIETTIGTSALQITGYINYSY